MFSKFAPLLSSMDEDEDGKVGEFTEGNADNEFLMTPNWLDFGFLAMATEVLLTILYAHSLFIFRQRSQTGKVRLHFFLAIIQASQLILFSVDVYAN